MRHARFGAAASLETEQRNATCGNRAYARSHIIPPRLELRGGPYEEVEPESSGRTFRYGEFDPGSE